MCLAADIDLRIFFIFVILDLDQVWVLFLLPEIFSWTLALTRFMTWKTQLMIRIFLWFCTAFVVLLKYFLINIFHVAIIKFSWSWNSCWETAAYICHSNCCPNNFHLPGVKYFYIQLIQIVLILWGRAVVNYHDATHLFRFKSIFFWLNVIWSCKFSEMILVLGGTFGQERSFWLDL